MYNPPLHKARYISRAVLPSPVSHLCDVRNSAASLEPKQQYYELSVATGKHTISMQTKIYEHAQCLLTLSNIQ